jgi:hypothetical protein
MNRAMPHKYGLLLSHKLLFFRKHHGKLAAEVFRTGLYCSTVLKLLWWTLVRLLKRDHGPSRQKLHLHWHLLRRMPSL